QTFDLWAKRHSLRRRRMTENAWVAEERLPPVKGVDVCATNADTMHPHQRLSWPRRCRRFGRGKFEIAWLVQTYCSYLHLRHLNDYYNVTCHSGLSEASL